MSLSHCKNSQGKYLFFQVDIPEVLICGFLLYTVKRSLAKLNIKHRMCCNEPTDYKMLTKFLPDIFALFYGKDVTPIYWGIACTIFRPHSFGWKIKILGSIFSLQINFFG